MTLTTLFRRCFVFAVCALALVCPSPGYADFDEETILDLTDNALYGVDGNCNLYFISPNYPSRRILLRSEPSSTIKTCTALEYQDGYFYMVHAGGQDLFLPNDAKKLVKVEEVTYQLSNVATMTDAVNDLSRRSDGTMYASLDLRNQYGGGVCEVGVLNLRASIKMTGKP